MGDVVVAADFAWAVIFVWFGGDLALREHARRRITGALLIALALVPSAITLWLVA